MGLMGPYQVAYAPYRLGSPSMEYALVKYAVVGAFLPPTKPQLLKRSLIGKHAQIEGLQSSLWQTDIAEDESPPAVSGDSQSVKTSKVMPAVSQYFVEFVTSKGQQETRRHAREVLSH